jgi:predicted dienelactone hydrolase
VVNGKQEAVPEDDAHFETRIADMAFVIDHLAEVNSSDDILKGSLDLTRLGIYGHSFGGTTAVEACRRDARCLASIVIDWRLQGEISEVGTSKPIMLLDAEWLSFEKLAQEVLETSGQTLPEAAFDGLKQIYDSRETTNAMLLDMSPDAYHVIVEGTRHYSFTDVILIANIQPAIYAAISSKPSIDAERGERVIGDYILAFFDTYLKGEPSPLLDGASDDYPEVHLNRGEN